MCIRLAGDLVGITISKPGSVDDAVGKIDSTDDAEADWNSVTESYDGSLDEMLVSSIATKNVTSLPELK
jgi:hypothetical protein